jgi:hypothetical protein
MRAERRARLQSPPDFSLRPETLAGVEKMQREQATAASKAVSETSSI